MKIELDTLTDIILHISEVAENLGSIAAELQKRACSHDRSKFQDPEFSAFISTKERFKKVNYGTPEYAQLIEEIKPAIEHHYIYNRHHVEHHSNGIKDMNLIDLVELLADWKAAERRNPSKKLGDTLDYAFKKYKIDEQLSMVLCNTLKYLKWI